MDHAAQLRAYADSFITDGLEARGLRAAANEIERLRAKAEWADEASELMYNFATGKDDGAAIIAYVRAKLELV